MCTCRCDSQIEQQAQRLCVAKLEKEGEKRAQLAAVEKNLRVELETKVTTYEARWNMQKEVQVLAAKVVELTLQMEQKRQKTVRGRTHGEEGTGTTADGREEP